MQMLGLLLIEKKGTPTTTHATGSTLVAARAITVGN
jgi:hypothetical protein